MRVYECIFSINKPIITWVNPWLNYDWQIFDSILTSHLHRVNKTMFILVTFVSWILVNVFACTYLECACVHLVIKSNYVPEYLRRCTEKWRHYNTTGYVNTGTDNRQKCYCSLSTFMHVTRPNDLQRHRGEVKDEIQSLDHEVTPSTQPAAGQEQVARYSWR